MCSSFHTTHLADVGSQKLPFRVVFKNESILLSELHLSCTDNTHQQRVQQQSELVQCLEIFRRDFGNPLSCWRRIHTETCAGDSSVVISQTISWESQVRLATVARISVFIE